MHFASRRDVAIGRFVALDTPVHRLDPRTKLAAFTLLLALVFAVGPVGSAILLALLIGASRVAGLPGSRLAVVLKGLTWIFVVTLLYQTAWVGPRSLGGWIPGLVSGCHMVLRLAAMMVAATLLTYTTEPIRLADGLAGTFGFLKRVGVPVRDLAMVLTLALRFLPTVLEQAQRIVTAQRARGARFEGGPIRRARMILPLAVPLFARCLHRADTLALAMEARGYGSDRPRRNTNHWCSTRRMDGCSACSPRFRSSRFG
jgi:energy-coupling factor transport system permease protein